MRLPAGDTRAAFIKLTGFSYMDEDSAIYRRR